MSNHFVSGRGNIIGAGRLMAAIFGACIVTTTVCIPLGEASAKTKVEGKSDAVSLTAEDAPIDEVLAALSFKFGVVYTPPPGLNRTVGGTYLGSLREVLTRILDGCDYVVSYSGNKIDVAVIGQSGSTARPSGLPSQPLLGAASTAVNAPAPGPGPAKGPAFALSSTTLERRHE